MESLLSSRLALPIGVTGSAARRARAAEHELTVTQLAPDPDQPSPRYQHTATVLGAGSNRCVHSGLLSPNAIHVYNVLGARWLKTIPQGFAPSARCGHVAATLGLNRLLVTGGVSERGPESDSALLTLARSDTWDPQEV
ncbi:hypothetical protein T492DRAFT_1151927 [Pavlovales sp. CCMP2436]|nr:hypothetical protein T492DRAFT_1151927 [Pavlovales sp. CCMP2436]